MRLTRRAALLGLGATIGLGGAALALAPAATERRLVVVILRGAMDGLSAVQPYGDPELAALRPELLTPPPGQPQGLLDLGGFHGLHPALPGLHALYARNEALVLHALASDDRSRSHFVAQDTLEFGAIDHSLRSGWLNRLAGLLPSHAAAEPALAVGSGTPLLLRGPAPVGTYFPAGPAAPPADFYSRLVEMHANDTLTREPLLHGLKERGFTAAALAGAALPPNKSAFPALAAAAGALLAKPDGPRLAAMELIGWDTHARQAVALPGPLKVLDDGLVALKQSLREAWGQTAVLVLTEFGRTARANGTGGTDHGTASAAFLLGGAVQGGRVRADWPGLKPAQLFENRDLAPTADLRALVKGVLAEQYRLDARALDTVFPGAARVSPMSGLLRA